MKRVRGGGHHVPISNSYCGTWWRDGFWRYARFKNMPLFHVRGGGGSLYSTVHHDPHTPGAIVISSTELKPTCEHLGPYIMVFYLHYLCSMIDISSCFNE